MRGNWILLGVAVAVAVGVANSRAVAPVPVLEAAVTPVVTGTQVMEVHLVPPTELPGHRWSKEAAGYVTVLLEHGLADLPGLLPTIDGAPARPGLQGALPSLTSRWVASIGIGLDGDALTVRVHLCDPLGVCLDHEASGDRLRPNAAMVDILRSMAHQLQVEVAPEWTVRAEPEATDDYAALLLGRACAVLVGLIPPVTGSAIDDVRRDPLVRAAYLDPKMPTAQTIVARTRIDAPARAEAARLARLGPPSLARTADEAAALTALDKHDAALGLWQEVALAAPDDPRFIVPRARAALAAGSPEQSEAIIDVLQGAYGTHPDLVSLRVSIADARGGAEDALLARWQQLAPSDPRPVRRRIEMLIANHDHEGALVLTQELAARGNLREANRLQMALASDLGRYRQAADAAKALGEEDVALRLEALAGDPFQRVALLQAAQTPAAVLERGRIQLARGDAEAALADARRVLQDDPWWPEALHLLYEAHAARGELADARAALAKRDAADPLYGQDVH